MTKQEPETWKALLLMTLVCVLLVPACGDSTALTHTPLPTRTPTAALHPPTASPQPTQGAEPQPLEYRERGFESYRDGRYHEAIATFLACVQSYPQYGDCHNGLGMSYRELGDLTRALGSHNTAIELNEIRYDYYLERGTTHLWKGDYKSAIKDYSVCIDFNINSADCHSLLAIAYRENGQYKEALEYHSRAIDMQDDRAQFYWERGLTYQKSGDSQKAESDFERARQLGLE